MILRNVFRNIRRSFSSARESIDYDVAIVGGGPAGLATAIRLKQLAKDSKKPDLSVCVLEKGSAIGSHLISGCILEPNSLRELLPQHDFTKAPFNHVPVKDESLLFLTKKRAFPIPHFLHGKGLKNAGNWILSIGDLCRFLAKEAEDMGVEIFCGFPAVDLLQQKEGGSVVGVVTNSKGVSKTGEKKPTFEDGVDIKAKVTILAEGARGSLTKKVFEEHGLQKAVQMYTLGLKEVWKINSDKINQGYTAHTAGYPLSRNDFGGGFIYLGANNTLSLGLIVGLSYKNPYLNPYEEFQLLKSHPFVKKLLENGQRIGYGARVLEEGGFYSLPEKPGILGLLVVGSAAGYLDFSKIKGVHNALRSGKIAAESTFTAILEEKVDKVAEIHDKSIKKSKIYKELYEVRGYPGTFLKHTYLGYAFSLMSSFKAGRALMNWLSFKKTKACNENTEPASNSKRITYPPHDDVYSFDIDKSLALSGVHHEYDQPCHLKIQGDPKDYVDTATKIYDKPEERFCPGKVFEFSNGELKMNAQNCLHCKTCTIKSYKERIEWTCPEGNGGPN